MCVCECVHNYLCHTCTHTHRQTKRHSMIMIHIERIRAISYVLFAEPNTQNSKHALIKPNSSCACVCVGYGMPLLICVITTTTSHLPPPIPPPNSTHMDDDSVVMYAPGVDRVCVTSDQANQSLSRIHYVHYERTVYGFVPLKHPTTTTMRSDWVGFACK